MKIAIALVSVVSVLMLAAPSYADYVEDLHALQGDNNPCERFGGGWKTFAYDGTSKISYCAKVISGNPNNSLAVTDLTGVYNGRCSGGFKEFAFDGTANIRFCVKKDRVSSSSNYVKNVGAQMGNGCQRGWDRFVFNGRSNISFCAVFNQR